VRLNLTDDEGRVLTHILEDWLGAPGATYGDEALSIKAKVKAAREKEAAREPAGRFETDDVVGVRMRGHTFPKGGGRPRMGPSSLEKWGWLLTHKETGKVDELRPCNGFGVSKREAKRHAVYWAKLVERGAD